MTDAQGHDVVVVGSANLDHVALVDRLPDQSATIPATGYFTAAGGKGVNQAVSAARQGVGVAFVGCVGDDAAGLSLRDLLRAEQIDTTGLHCLPGEATGIALVTVGSGGENTVVVAALANGRMTANDVEAAGLLIDRARVLLVQLEIPVEAVRAALSRAMAAGVTTVLNPAPATGPLPGELLALVDVLVPNLVEAAALTGRPASGSSGSSGEGMARALVAAGCPTVVVTMGEQGAVMAMKHRVDVVRAHSVDAVDSTAAGDAFCGVLAAGLARNLPLEVALRRATAAGALATTVRGAVPSLPAAGAIDRLLAAF
ncbi:MAG TPA: ribokinase [Acidimicrobiales bacterium]